MSRGQAVKPRRHGVDPRRIGYLADTGAARWGVANAAPAASPSSPYGGTIVAIVMPATRADAAELPARII
jgi:hypothetical protein